MPMTEPAPQPAPQQGGASGEDAGRELFAALDAQLKSFSGLGEALKQVGAPPEAMGLVQEIVGKIQALTDLLGGGKPQQAPAPAPGQGAAEAGGNPRAIPVR